MDLIFFKVKAGFRNGSSFKYMRNAKIDGVADFRDKLESVWFETLDLASEINEGGFLVKINPDGTETPLDYKDVSILLDRTEKEIEVCFAFFIEQGMIDKLNGKLGITNWEKYQNSTKLELIQEKNRERQRIWYENHKKQAETNPNVRPNVSLTQPNATEVDVRCKNKKENITKDGIGKESLTDDDLNEAKTIAKEIWKNT